MTDIAHELSRRASPRYIGDQAKEKALNKTNEWKEQIAASPMALGLIGGTIGALVGRALARERQVRTYGMGGAYGMPRYQPQERYQTAFADENGVRFAGDMDGGHESGRGIGEKIAGTAHDLKEKAGDMVTSVREHMPSAAEVGHTVDDNPLMVALGGLALGAVAALLLPVSRKEREMLDPVKQRAGEAIGSLGDKIGDGVQQAREKIAGDQDPQRQSQLAERNSPTLPH